MKQCWATRCQKCIKHQLLCTARCALRRKKQEASRSSGVHCHLCHTRCQSTPTHCATCGCTGGRASGKLEAATGSLWMHVPSTGSKFWGPPSAPGRYRSGMAALSSARRCKTVRAWKLRAVMQSSCKSWASSKAAEAPSRAATALATRFKKAAE